MYGPKSLLVLGNAMYRISGCGSLVHAKGLDLHILTLSCMRVHRVVVGKVEGWRGKSVCWRKQGEYKLHLIAKDFPTFLFAVNSFMFA